MSTSAVVMMTVAILLVWGGLATSILFMRSRPHVEGVEDPDLQAEDDARAQRPHPTRDL